MAIIWMRRRKLYSGKTGLLIWSGVVVTIATGGGLVLFGPNYGIPTSPGYWLLGIYAWVWAVIGLSYAITPWAIRRRFKKFNISGRAYTIDWDDEKLTQQDKNTKGEFPWGQLTSWREDKKLIVLIFERIRAVHIPKRALDGETLKGLQSLLKTKVTSET